MSTRKDFIAATAALAAAPATAAAATPAPKAPAPDAAIPKLPFDLQAFDAILDRAVDYKHLFADREIDEGGGLYAVRNTLNAYRDIGVPLARVATAIVFYHGASICLGMDDHVWDTYLIPLIPHMQKADPKVAADLKTVVTSRTSGNPLLRPRKDDYGASLEALAGDGLHFFICNNALKGFVGEVAAAKDMRAADLYAEVTAHLIPNATVVPAGVWAVHYGQHKGYSILQTS